MQFYKFLLISCLVIVGFTTKAQTFMQDSVERDSLGEVNIIQDIRLEELLKTDSIINSKNPGFNGYRIQIFLGGSTDRERAFEVKEEFKELFPDERAYVIYTAPDFRVRVGNFRSKLESIELYKACLRYFPNCYPVKTRILFSDLEPLEDDGEEELIVDENLE